MMIHSLSMAKWGGSLRESHGCGDAALQEVHGLQATIVNNQFLQRQMIQMRSRSYSGCNSTRHFALSLQYFHGHPCTVLASRDSGTHQPQLLAFLLFIFFEFFVSISLCLS